MTQQKKASGEPKTDADPQGQKMSDLDLLAAIRRQLHCIYADLLSQTPPEQVAKVLQRLQAETKDDG
jgi:hypothetical protein